MSFGVGVGAFAQGFVGGYNAVQSAQARKQENEMRQQQLEMQKAQVEQQKAYQADLAKLSESFTKENTVQAGVDDMGKPVFTTKPMSYEQQMRYAAAAADVSMRHMKLDPNQYMQIAKVVEEARKEGTMDAIKAAHVGDLDGALSAFNRSGRKLNREDIVGFDQTEVELPGGVKMPSRVIRMKDGTAINTAEWLMKGMAFEKLYEVGARKQEAEAGRQHESMLTDKRIAAQAAEGAADRASRASIAAADRQSLERRSGNERLPAEVIAAQWYANTATPEERAIYERMKIKGGDAFQKFTEEIAGKYAGNIAYAGNPEAAAKDAVTLAQGVYQGFGIGQPKPDPAQKAKPRPVPNAASIEFARRNYNDPAVRSQFAEKYGAEAMRLIEGNQ
jgi:hypothetical protein